MSQVKAGDSIPNVELLEGAPDKKVNLAQELSSGKGLIIQVPAAFSPDCSARHIPEYINSKQLQSAGKVFVVAVNDAFVLVEYPGFGYVALLIGSVEWKLGRNHWMPIRFLADAEGNFSKQLGTQFEFAPIFGDKRSVRSAIVTEDGKIKSVHIEPDNIGIKESSAEAVLGK
ncbi:Peroxiredoxin-5, mitochondrial [Fulvia fulva]|uniref:Peroxiredoxin-5, mitochondrial n=1 Tax=Passalora fulva TaxID=5499 RepID=A0A9Q8PGX5_PASFU|nr:Peroxiredoxin-5, mitochondrial [Fulvia fulva]KAK4613232.1 Peroxiredoxin-5, mitochondrial [Fulvia fulva]KAK4614580.1 Peroxiredoxin-5, mitochondrial [Fulvia fulva]UJO22263.1 Peroxiredoxin-5, mitochondrial [Fulvia fulva]WPV20196.1 Peroxiredoxin-5, mitochondrial [Fulvia fulva]WPV34831.1 Peroxiredoxin-5, mitochondrial [Fulvia fulva]